MRITTKKSNQYAIKPDWYLTSQELSGVEGLAKKVDKFIELMRIMKGKNLGFAVVDLVLENIYLNNIHFDLSDFV